MKKSFRHIIPAVTAGSLLIVWMAAMTGCGYGQRSGGYLQTADHGRLMASSDIQRFWRNIPHKDSDADYLYQLARHFQQRGKFDLAVQPLLQVIEAAPQRAEAYNALGVSYDQLSKFDLAEKCYRRALVIKPDFAAAYNNLGYSRLMQGRPDEALEFFHQAIALQNGNPRFHNNLALAYRQSGTLPTASGQSLKAESDTPEQDSLPIPRVGNAITLAIADIQHTPIPTTAEQAAPSRPVPPVSDTTGRESTSGAPISSPPPVVQRQHSISGVGTGPVWTASQIEIANGNGEYRMARNLGRFFEGRGFSIQRLSNADHFGYPRTRILYSDGRQQDACSLARLLFGTEIDCDLIRSAQPHGRIKVLIGRDIAGLNPLFSGTMVIQVANGNGIQGMARKLTIYFHEKGFRTARPTNAGHFNFERTRIIYPPNRMQNARFVARQLPETFTGHLVRNDREGNVIKVIIGRDFRI